MQEVLAPVLGLVAVIGAVAVSVIIVRFATTLIKRLDPPPAWLLPIGQLGNYGRSSMPCRNGSISSSVPWSLSRIKVAERCRRVSA